MRSPDSAAGKKKKKSKKSIHALESILVNIPNSLLTPAVRICSMKCIPCLFASFNYAKPVVCVKRITGVLVKVET